MKAPLNGADLLGPPSGPMPHAGGYDPRLRLYGDYSALPGSGTFGRPFRRPPCQRSRTKGGLYQEGYALLLFEDAKARAVGDTITIILRERTDATKSSNASAGKSTSIAATVCGYLSMDAQAVDGSVDLQGSGSADQRNELNGEITVTIASILANGNLVVRGEKMIGINQAEFIQVEGIVRPEDVRPDNTVLSQRVANAYIHHGGEGNNAADANRAGFVDALLPVPPLALGDLGHA